MACLQRACKVAGKANFPQMITQISNHKAPYDGKAQDSDVHLTGDLPDRGAREGVGMEVLPGGSGSLTPRGNGWARAFQAAGLALQRP